MFSRNNKKRMSAKIDSLIGHNTELQGNVLFSGGLHIDGKLMGNVVAHEPTSLLTLSEQGVVEGEVRVPNILLNGSVIGDVYASERVELAANAKVTGNVYYNLIEMAIGAEVNGNLVHKPEGGRNKSEAESVGKPVSKPASKPSTPDVVLNPKAHG